ncbi:MAG: helix-turn-helix transcriptional regulator [Candidatus Korobacteraceae bacterium]
MISNERQYRISKARVEEFKRALESLPAHSDQLTWDNVQRDAISSQLSDLRRELQEYEWLRKKGPDILEVTALEGIPTALVKARIAAGLTQRELADKLGLKEQQVQRYEATAYASASLDRIQEVMSALGLKLGKGVFLPSEKVSLTKLYERAKELGITSKLLRNRLMPSTASAVAHTGLSAGQQQTIALQLAARVERVFHVPSQALFSDLPLTLPAGVLAQAKFKLPAKVDRRKVSAYAVYAHYLSILLLQCQRDVPQRPIPSDPAAIHADIVRKYRSLTLKSCLEYVWDLGIPVLPLREPGGFHGACWRVNGRNVIVLKQAANSNGRWIVDLFHEMKHSGEHPELPNFAWIESLDPSEINDDEEEEETTDFAVEVALAGNAEKLAKECARECRGDVSALKAAVPRVAKRHGVRVDVLANYLAHRLADDNVDWWGTAQGLQETSPDPWTTARDVLLSRVDCSRLNPVDLDVLTRSLSEEAA